MPPKKKEENTTREHSFDYLARRVASGTIARGRALRLLGCLLLGGVLAAIPGLSGGRKTLAQSDGETSAKAQAGDVTAKAEGGALERPGGTPCGMDEWFEHRPETGECCLVTFEKFCDRRGRLQSTRKVEACDKETRRGCRDRARAVDYPFYPYPA